VRELVDAFNKRHTSRLRELIAVDCEWDTYADGQATGPEALRSYIDERFGAAMSAVIVDYTVREIGGSIALSGSLNVVERGGALAQRQIHWVFEVRDGKIARARSFARREEALAAARSATAG
jgi:ketosteroid isomerase-like protein